MSSSVRELSVNNSSAIDVLLRHSFNTRTDSRLLFELLKSEKNENNWSRNFLREQFKKKDLDKLFSKYRSRIQQSSLTIGLVFIIVFCFTRITSSLLLTEIAKCLISVCLYGVTAFMCGVLLSAIIAERFVGKWNYAPWVIFSIFLLLMLTLADYSYVMAHRISRNRLPRLSPTYIHILVAYFFLTFPKLKFAAVAGFALSLVELLFAGLVFYAQEAEVSEECRVYPLTADAIFLLTCNVLGFYKTYLEEVNQRRAFLDHRMCIESQLKYDLEKVQEERLMLSVVPLYILDSIKMDIRDGIQFRNLEPRGAKLFGDFYIKKHSSVSVLFSDIVNFTVLTCTLEVQELVVLLSRLFGRFDEIASKNECERIRIVGDCYVAASGLPPHHKSSHARNCVEQAIRMLEIIREVKSELRVNLDMRIGIHSGTVMSGILGVRKWQYDIWSKDVDIANLMEHTGRPGLIHISESTFKLLSAEKNDGSMIVNIHGQDQDGGFGSMETDRHIVNQLLNRSKPFVTSASDSINDDDDEEDEGKGDSTRNSSAELSMLLPIGNMVCQCKVGDAVNFEDKLIKAYFIIPPSIVDEECEDAKQMSKYLAIKRRARIFPNKAKQAINKGSSSSMDYSPLEISDTKYDKLANRINHEMDRAIDKMALSKKEQWSDSARLHPLFLTFQPPYSEMGYAEQQDCLFKYYLLAVCLIFLAIFAINVLTTASRNRYVFVPYLVALAPLMLLVYCAWHDTIVNGGPGSGSPKTRLNSFLTVISRSLCTNLNVRVTVWCLVAFSLLVLIVIDGILSVSFDGFRRNQCFDDSRHGLDKINYPRYYTYSIALVVTCVASFLHIHFAMKLIVYAVILVAFYSAAFFLKADVIYESFLPGHFVVNKFPIDQSVYITFIVLCHHLMDRQIDYLSRLDFIWKRDLRSKQEDSSVMALVNKFLVQNIIPLHVVDHYLYSRQDNEFYHERHDKVAVMFANIRNFFYLDDTDTKAAEDGCKDPELASLKVLNEVITEIDNLLLKPEFSRVEKIKVIGTTYMAAAGLKPNVRRTVVDEVEELEPFDVETNLVTLVNMATAMMQTLEKFNRYNFQEYELRVGIDCGPSMAGVVGNYKPIYDVWGNAVNVASRMESTGENKKIQVTEETAQILARAGRTCECRGEVLVKGKGMLTTYFVVQQPPFSPGVLQEWAANNDDGIKLSPRFEQFDWRIKAN